MNSWQYYLIKGILKSPFHSLISECPDIKKVRTLFNLSSSVLSVHPQVVCDPMIMDNIDGCVFVPSHESSSCVLLYLHGGAYVMGSAKTHQSFLSYLSAETKMRIYAPNYRLAPEHPFPAALDDIETCYRWLVQHHKNIIIAGESAGGGLTIATLLKLKQKNLPYPKAGIALSPWLDLALTGESLKTNQKKDKVISIKTLPFIVNAYLQGADPFHPLASPLYGDLRGLPPLFLQVSASEVLFSDTDRFAKKAQEAGVEITQDVEEDGFHAWPLLSSFLPEGRDSIRKIAQFIEKIRSSLTS